MPAAAKRVRVFIVVQTSSKRKVSIKRTSAIVRFGSEADICAAIRHVRFAPNSDRESGFPQTVMSALPLKADMCGARGHVCFGPKADMSARYYSGLSEAPSNGWPITNQISLFVCAASQVRTGKEVKTCNRTAATKITAT